MTPELLSLQTYERVFQRLVSTHKDIPLGIYRTVEITKKFKVYRKWGTFMVFKTKKNGGRIPNRVSSI